MRSLASAIAARYGVPVDALVSRLSVGSFRVKSGADLETATRYARDLEGIGAVCELRDSTTGRVLELTNPDDPSGLAAASNRFSQDLGALDQGNLALSTLDGRTGDTAPPPVGVAMSEPYNLTTPPAGMPALPPSDGPSAFAPPVSEAAEEELMLAVDPRLPAEGYEETAAPPPPRTMAAEMPDGAPARVLSSVPQDAGHAKPGGPSLGERFSRTVADGRTGLAKRSRGAFIAGVAIALVLGMFVAHVVAVFQETNAYSPVRKDLLVSYSEATDPDAHAALTSIRAGAADILQSRKRRIAITSLVVWVLAATGIAFLWFRVVPWERLARPQTIS